ISACAADPFAMRSRTRLSGVGAFTLPSTGRRKRRAAPGRQITYRQPALQSIKSVTVGGRLRAQPAVSRCPDAATAMVYIEWMISYVLVMIISLTSGQITHAFVEGPMADSWCEQLIQHQEYSGQNGGTFRTANCLR